MRFVSKIDTAQIPISRTVFEQLNEPPTAVVEGRYYYNLESRLVNYFDGNSWKVFVTYDSNGSLTLNSNITSASQNETCGLNIARLADDNVTRKDVAFQYDVTQNYWTAKYGPTSGTLKTKRVALSHSESFGDGINTSYTINHELGTEDVIVSVKEVANKELVYCDIKVLDQDSILVYNLQVPPGANELKVTVVG